MIDPMALSAIKKLLGLASEIIDEGTKTDAERYADAERQRREMEEAQRMLKALEYKVDVMMRGGTGA